VTGDLKLAIESFVKSCSQPVLSEPGEELIQLQGENLSLDAHLGGLSLQAWNEQRNLVRRVIAIESQSRSKLVLRVERFGKKFGTLSLLDLKKLDRQLVGLRTSRQEFREVFRRFLRREFPGFRLGELSTEADLEQSLSPAFPRALIHEGTTALAAIGAGPDSNVDSMLTFGLIWLDYLRSLPQRLTIRGLVLFLPAGRERNTCLRLHFLDPQRASYAALAYSEEGCIRRIDLADYGNVDTRVEPCRRAPLELDALSKSLLQISGVETVQAHSGALIFRVHGLEFARLADGVMTAGLETKRKVTASNGSEILTLARELVRLRAFDSPDRQHPFMLRNPECWLESQVRAHLEDLDPSLCVNPVYGQVPALAASGRGLLDLLAVDRCGRLAVIELKASQDIQLPLQALDYWIRVKWHLDRREFSRQGYFPGTQIGPAAPRLLLVAPALDFHPTNERVLRFFSPEIQVERFGVGIQWQQELKLMYRI
jgi:hypothetical protein